MEVPRAHFKLALSLLLCSAVLACTCAAYDLDARHMWGRLLRDYPAAQVVPFALLVPFVGSAASSVVFGETFGSLRLAGMVTVVGGIAIMVLSKRPKDSEDPKISEDKTSEDSASEKQVLPKIA